MEVILVLGAGGPLGRAFHAGLIEALGSETGWDPRAADVLIGTSAGAQIAALLRAQPQAAHPAHLAQLVSGWDDEHDGLPRRWPASPPYLGRSLRRPLGVRPGRLCAALLPEGTRVPRALAGLLAHVHPEGAWPARALWINAVALETGARVVFGRAGEPQADVTTAVLCSSAVPGLRRPVSVEGIRYVDGGIASPTHVDLLDTLPRPSRQRVVIVSSPLSRFAPLRRWLRREVGRLRRAHHRLFVFEPGAAAIRAMGWNPLSRAAAAEVAAAAFSECVRWLDGEAAPLRDALSAARASLPQGDAHGR